MPTNTDKNKSERILAEVKNIRENNKIIEVEEEKTELVIFSLDNNYYAFNGEDIKEILPYEEITYVPGCPDFIIGIINVRGDIESVLNIHVLMGLPETKSPKNSRIIIAFKKNIRSGILVDSVEDVIEVPTNLIKRPISTLDKAVREFAVGGETIYGRKYVTILDIGKIFGKIAG
ncbi:MAG: purine-binding chemotaxis protein CheW [Desulfobacteraceae bacterium]|nr:purine-binding chemotaxis protein CheW [Desulfobacteraceae bacterium]